MGQLRIIWASLIAGVLLYTAVFYGLLASGGFEGGGVDPSVMGLAGPAVLVYMGAGLLLRRSLVGRIDRGAPPAERLAAYRGAMVTAWAVSESGGLILVVLGLLSGSRGWILAGGLAAALLMVTAPPSAADVGLDD